MSDWRDLAENKNNSCHVNYLRWSNRIHNKIIEDKRLTSRYHMNKRMIKVTVVIRNQPIKVNTK